MKKGLLLFALLIFIGCNDKVELKKESQSQSQIHIIAPIKIISQDATGKEHIESELIINPTDNNFLIDEQGCFFYYGKKKDYSWDCIPEKNPLPKFIHLDPSQIIALSDKQIEEFVNLNIQPIKNELQLISVASARDTFKSATLTKLINTFRKNKLGYILRPMTEEEKVVLSYRKSGEDYFYWNVAWDTTKIKLDFKPEAIINLK